MPRLISHNRVFKATPKKKSFADQLRRQMTRAETRLWSQLRHISRGPKTRPQPKWRPQVVVCGWIVDFYNDEKLIALEIDGPTHDPERDKLRDSVLAQYGIRTIRYTNEAVYSQLSKIIHDLEILSVS